MRATVVPPNASRPLRCPRGCIASALETPAYGPGAGGVVYLLLPPLALQMLIFCAASLIARQRLRAAAFAMALAACVLCFRCLYGLTCP